MSVELARIGGPVASLGLAVLLVAPRRDLRLAGLAAWALGGLALLPLLAPGGQRTLLAAAAVAGVLAVAGVALLLSRSPWLLPLAALLCVPVRVHVDIGDTDANLLVPLYLLVGGAALLLAWELARGDDRRRELGPVAWPLALFVAWSGLTLAWTDDAREGAISLAFFVLPFGLLAVALARLEWTRQVVVRLFGLLVGLALAFAAVGVFQWLTRDIFWNPKVIVGNAYQPELFFRVNSVFWDPSIYGRFLVVAILSTLVVVLLAKRRELLVGGTLVVAAVWIGLLPSFSQSSFAALITGTLLAAGFVWRWRAAAALGLTAVVALSLGFSAPPIRDEIFDQSLERATGGRSKLVTEGLRIAADHPVAGVGVGGFKDAYAERSGLRGEDPQQAASHNTPVTVAAETGVPGLVLFAWLLAAGLLAALRRAGASLDGRAALAVGLSLAAIAAHSLFYNAFFEDPMTWGLLALCAVPVASAARMRA